jgi:NADH-quinone oxidoreductase subunit L
MEGPTPVSALIHAATMVAAGIYMLCRINVLMVPDALTVIMWTGTATALYAALCAITQSDIKKVLAYSTLSQLGYMVAAFGLGSLAMVAHMGGHAQSRDRRRRRRRDVPPHDARLLQSPHVPRLRLRHPRLPPRAGHLQNGRPAHADAAHVLDLHHRRRRHHRLSVSRRLLLEGRDPLPRVRQQQSRLRAPRLTAVLTSFYMVRLWKVTFLGEAAPRGGARARERLGHDTARWSCLRPAFGGGGYGWFYSGVLRRAASIA